MVSCENESSVKASPLMPYRYMIAVNGAILLCLAIHRAVILRREASGLSGMGLVHVLIRDQAIYFAA